jgi:hypothetical protein
MDRELLNKIFAEGQRKIRSRTVEGDTVKVRVPAPWEFAHSEDLDWIIQEAVKLGWKDNKVQVKRYQHEDTYTFYIEPFEEDCSCPGLLKYDDYVVGG